VHDPPSVIRCTYSEIPEVLVTTRIAGRCGMRRGGLQHRALTCIYFRPYGSPSKKRYVMRLSSRVNFAFTKLFHKAPDRPYTTQAGIMMPPCLKKRDTGAHRRECVRPLLCFLPLSTAGALCPLRAIGREWYQALRCVPNLDY